MQALDTEIIQQGLLHIDEVANGHQREVGAPGLAGVGVVTGRAGGGDSGVAGVEVDQGVRRHDVIAVGVERLAGADDGIPVARGLFTVIAAGGVTGAGEEVGDQDGVIACLVELAIGLPADSDRGDGVTADGGVAWHLEDLFGDIVQAGGRRLVMVVGAGQCRRGDKPDRGDEEAKGDGGARLAPVMESGRINCHHEPSLVVVGADDAAYRHQYSVHLAPSPCCLRRPGARRTKPPVRRNR